MLRPNAELVIKCGPEGAVAQVSKSRFKASSPASDIIDTIGAGDAFNAGYLAARQMGLNPDKSLAAGCAVASAVIQAFPRSTAPLDLNSP
jgi:sugar/nucleoside kinase (ribokinase family)